MPIVMYNKKTGRNVKVYGFVMCSNGVDQKLHAVTYQLAAIQHTAYEATADDLVLKLVLAEDLRPLDL